MGLKSIIVDVQYLLLVLWVTGVSTFTAWNLFMPLFVLSAASLVLVFILGYLVYKNLYWKNKVMNVSLIVAIITWFIFALYFISYFGGNQDSRQGTLVCLTIAIAAIAVYAVFKNQMHKLYYHLISVLYIENDFRLSKESYRPIKALFNFVA